MSGQEAYSLVGVQFVVPASVGIGQRDWKRGEPSEQVEPLEDFVLAHKGHHKQSVQVEALAEHPKVVGHQEVMEHNVPEPTLDL